MLELEVLDVGEAFGEGRVGVVVVGVPRVRHEVGEVVGVDLDQRALQLPHPVRHRVLVRRVLHTVQRHHHHRSATHDTHDTLTTTRAARHDTHTNLRLT